jgi:hypothetical protein
VIVLLSLSLGVGISTSNAPDAPIRALNNFGPCPGGLLAHNYSGIEVIDGPASGGGPISLVVSYEAAFVTNLSNGTILRSDCLVENQTIVPGTNGSFALSIYPTPEVSCTPAGTNLAANCTSIEGPYEQVSVAPTYPLPVGYFPSIVQNGTAFRVGFYPYLANVTLDPGGPSSTISVGAQATFRAEPMSGEGTPTPMTPNYEWTLTGVGWTFAAPPRGSTVNVSAAPGALIGNLSVVASIVVPGGTQTAPPASMELLAVATTISSASLNRTLLDLGESIGVAVNGSGGAGYTYTATLRPGLGAPATTSPCTSTPGVDGIAALSCTVVGRYTVSGVAQPVVTVSNGFSAATWSFPDVTVDPAPSILASPSAPVGYSNETIPIFVEAASGTGTAPYQMGCLANGDGSIRCIDSPGPTWVFDPIYPAPGQYSALAWMIDATGVNRSAAVPVRVVAPLGVTVEANATVAAVGTPVSIEAFVTGGDLPARVWWNATGTSDPTNSAWVSADGPVVLTVYPSATGFLTVSVNVVDRLGTVVAASQTWAVGPGLATEVVPVVLPATDSIRAGTPLSIDWQALDSAGEAVHDFSSAAEIDLSLVGSDRSAPGWVNASGIGPVPSPVPGWFNVPSTAWIGGSLNVSVTSSVSGTIDIALTIGAGLPARTGVVPANVLPDVYHLRLRDPVTTIAGERANATLWQVTDRFGNAVPGASVVITRSFDGVSASSLAPILLESDGGTEVWVNFSAPNLFAGTITVTDLAGDVLLPTILVPGLPSAWSPLLAALPLLVALPVGAVAGSVTFLRRRRTSRPVGVRDGGDEESALQRLAEGRATVVEIVRRSGPIDLAGLAVSWEPPPASAELADWVASLLTDGTLDATFGPDGVARFCLPVDEGRGDRVTLDLEEFDRVQSRRDEVRAEAERDDP